MLEKRFSSTPWGKADGLARHHLAHHMADVAACFESICALPVVRARMERAANLRLTDIAIARLSVIAFLHDAGKLHPGFQAKAWPDGLWRQAPRGHVAEGAIIFKELGPLDIAQNLALSQLIEWGVDEDLLHASFAHHGQPTINMQNAEQNWDAVQGYDPFAASRIIGASMRAWFADAFTSDPSALPKEPDFKHLFCGLVALADWLGSNSNIFTFEETLNPDYMTAARAKARRAARMVGLDVEALRGLAAGRTSFARLTGLANAPRPQQRLAAEYSLQDLLVILEAETGSGKTEAAFWRFVRLFEAGLVDALYFALPTRAAAIQIHGRVNKMLKHLFGADAPEAVLAVPGYMKSGEIVGHPLPDWRVRWDDNPDEKTRLSRWAAESAKRYLAACVAVGTVDQAMLAGLKVKHAHLRAAALSRSLIVIDEVHASDRYMREVQNHLLKTHVRRGGHALLMSATLGSVARAKYLGWRSVPHFAEAVAAPYPAVWGKNTKTAQSADASQQEKRIAMQLLPTMAAQEAAALAIEAAKQGARALVIRNTVTQAIATWRAVRAAGHDDLLLQADHGPALHHSRFAPEDRALLDGAVEEALSPDPLKRPSGGVIVIGTQTLEQSLDIDADLLICDLCPVDVLLQRIGRLHRHSSPRAPGFTTARRIVLTPEKGLAPLLAPAFENGLGGWLRDHVLQGVYRDLSVLELTRRLVESEPIWTIPAQNRWLVESATHPEKIETLHQEMGEAWAHYANRVYGADVAAGCRAQNVVLQVEEAFASSGFSDDEEKIRTRLGGEGAQLVFAAPILGPFGRTFSRLTLPEHWSHGIDASAPVAEMTEKGVFIRAGAATFFYDRSGLTKAERKTG